MRERLLLWVSVRPQLNALIYRLTFLWGLILLWPGNTFATSPAFRTLSIFVSEQLWGLMLCFLALRLRKAKSLRAQRDALFGLLVVWIFITVNIVIANPLGTSSAVYPILVYYIFRQYLTVLQDYERLRYYEPIAD